MITIVEIDKNYKYLKEVRNLYYYSFPINERDPINHLLNSEAVGHYFLAFEDDNKFIGFAYLLSTKNITHILYLATIKSLRGKGYGHLILSLIESWKNNSKIIVDVEAIENNDANKEIKQKRIDFYKSASYTMSDINYSWNNVNYNLMCYGKMISKQEFDDFWKHFKFDEDMGNFLFEIFKVNK